MLVPDLSEIPKISGTALHIIILYFFFFLFIAPSSYDLTDRDAVRQLMSNQKHHMKQLDTALGDVMADFDDEEDLVIDEKKDDVPIKLRLSIGGPKPRPKSPKKTFNPVIRQRSKAMEDFDMTKVHQDDEYIYPSLELSDDEMDVGPSVHIGTSVDHFHGKIKFFKKVETVRIIQGFFREIVYFYQTSGMRGFLRIYLFKTII